MLEEQQSCLVPRLESQTGGIFLKVEDLTSLLSEAGGEEELDFQGELWLDLSGSASGGRGCQQLCLKGQSLPAFWTLVLTLVLSPPI